jgi:hypothetical protein
VHRRFRPRGARPARRVGARKQRLRELPRWPKWVRAR